MRAAMSILTGLGIPLAACGLVFAAAWLGRIPLLMQASLLGLGSGLTLGPLGALLGWLAVRRRVSPTPLRDAAQLASIAPAIVSLALLLVISHRDGATAALVCGPFLFLPGPAAAACTARLWLAAAKHPG